MLQYDPASASQKLFLLHYAAFFPQIPKHSAALTEMYLKWVISVFQLQAIVGANRLSEAAMLFGLTKINPCVDWRRNSVRIWTLQFHRFLSQCIFHGFGIWATEAESEESQPPCESPGSCVILARLSGWWVEERGELQVLLTGLLTC